MNSQQTKPRPTRALGLQYRIGVCTPAVYRYTCTINGGDLSAVDIVYAIWVEGEGGNYPFTPHYKSKKYMFLLGDQFFPNQDGVVCYYF